VGIIDSTWGGTMVESWTRLAALGEDASLMPIFASRGRMTDREANALLEDKRQQKLIAEAKAAGKPVPQFPWHPWLAMWGPGLLYNGMIAPLTPLPIRGVIWYQGESNTSAERAPLYGRLFRTMMEDWRRAWNQADLPFLFVQLAGYTAAPDSQWPELREAQRRTLGVAHTGMAVAIDLGERDNIHPKNKTEVGRRLSLAARALVYGEPLEFSGPLFRRTTPEDGALRLWFDHAGGGLAAPGGGLRGFEIAGADRRWASAAARIEDKTVVVSSPLVPAPLYVRYGWADFPDCNLFNVEGLPAAPFRSE